MIRIGIEGSKPLLNLLADRQIEIDFVKLAGDDSLETVEKALNYKPVMIHDVASDFWLNYQDPFIEKTMVHARQVLDAAQCPWFSTGIGASAEPQGHTSPNWRGAELSALQSREVVAENITRNSKHLMEWLGEDMPLLLENFNYHPTNAYEYICEPDFFTALINRIGCGMLLDLSHARISAYNMKWASVEQYLNALPLNKVREIHISHPAVKGEQMMDMHEPIQMSDVEILAWALAHTPAEAVSLEVSDNINETILQEQAEMLRTAIKMSGRVQS